MARFDTHTWVLKSRLAFAAFVHSPRSTRQYIDALVKAKLQKLVFRSAICSDEDLFEERASTLSGCATEEETLAFVADTAPDKRSRWVDPLLNRKSLARYGL